MDWVESAEAIGEVDELLARVGLRHGRRKTLAGTWEGGERRGRSKPGAVNEQGGGRNAGVVRAAGWEKYEWLRHGFSTRAGGVSSIYGERSLNLGFTKEDDAANVAESRRRLVGAVAGVGKARLVTLRQIHSGLIRAIGREGKGGGRVEKSGGRLGGAGGGVGKPRVVTRRKIHSGLIRVIGGEGAEDGE